MLLCNSNLVGHWNNWDRFHELDRAGLMMYGQMTAGSWIYIGTQGILQGTYETFAAAATKHFGGSLAGKLVVTGGMGGMGGAQPLAATMNGAAFLGIDVDPERIKRRVKTGYCDVMVTSLDEALRILKNAVRKGEATSVGLVGNCADLIPEMARRGVVPDLLTDQTSAHDPVGGYVPNGMTLEAALELRKKNPEDYKKHSMAAMAQHVQGMLDLQKLGAVTFDYGNNIRTFAFEQGVKNAYDFPGFVPAYIRPLFCEGKGPFRWAALSGEASDIARADRLVLEMFPKNEHLARWIKLAQKRVKFQGLPSRICWLGYGERDKFGLGLNDLVARGEFKAPIVIGRDHLDCGSVASPYRETESMLDGSDAIADWPLLNALVNTASGASWVSIHNGGGVGIGYSQHAGQVTVADGTKEMAVRIERVLTNDPGMGVVRHVDAGYSEATEFAQKVWRENSDALKFSWLDQGPGWFFQASAVCPLREERRVSNQRRSEGGMHVRHIGSNGTHRDRPSPRILLLKGEKVRVIGRERGTAGETLCARAQRRSLRMSADSAALTLAFAGARAAYFCCRRRLTSQ